MRTDLTPINNVLTDLNSTQVYSTPAGKHLSLQGQLSLYRKTTNMDPSNPTLDTFRYSLRFNSPITIQTEWEVEKHEGIIRDWLVLHHFSVCIVPTTHEAQCKHPASFAQKKRNTGTGNGAIKLVLVACDMMKHMRILRRKLLHHFHVELLDHCPACDEIVCHL